MTDEQQQGPTARLERRIDRLEERFGERLDRMAENLAVIANAQADFRATSAGLERAFVEIGQIKQRIEPLERDAPFVQLVTDGIKKLIRAIVWGALGIGIVMLYPSMPWVIKQPVQVQIEPKPPAPQPH